MKQQRMRLTPALALGAVILFGCLKFAVAQTNAPWEAWVEQGGQRWPMIATVKLKKEPFRIVFLAPDRYGLALVGSVSYAELAPLADKPDVGGSVRGTNIAAESPDRSNVELMVNEAGIVKKDFNGAQLWDEDPKVEKFSFQKRELGSDKRWTSTRQIEEICLDDGVNTSRCTSIARSSLKSIAVLMAGVPPIAPMTFNGSDWS